MKVRLWFSYSCNPLIEHIILLKAILHCVVPICLNLVVLQTNCVFFPVSSTWVWVYFNSWNLCGPKICCLHPQTRNCFSLEPLTQQAVILWGVGGQRSKKITHSSTVAYASKSLSKTLAPWYINSAWRSKYLIFWNLLNPNLKWTQAANTLASHLGDHVRAYARGRSRGM